MTALESAFSDMPATPRVTATRASDVRMRRWRTVYDGFLAIGALNMVAGREGSGKSLWAAHLIAQATTGRMPGEWMGTPVDVLVVGNEDDTASSWNPRLTVAGADLSRVLYEPMDADTGLPVNMATRQGRDLIAEFAHDNGVRFVYADHLSHLIPSDTSLNDYGDAGRVLRELHKWAEDTGLLLLGGWHMTKGGGNVQDKVLGSVAVRSSLRSLVTMATHPEKGTVYIALDKANNANLNRPAKGFDVMTETLLVDGEYMDVPRCGIVGDMDHPGSGKDYVASLIEWASHPPRQSDADGHNVPPDEWLVGFLTRFGPTPKMTVVGEAESAGYSERTVERAAGRIRVQRRTVGRESVWALLPDPEEDDA